MSTPDLRTWADQNDARIAAAWSVVNESFRGMAVEFHLAAEAFARMGESIRDFGADLEARFSVDLEARFLSTATARQRLCYDAMRLGGMPVLDALDVIAREESWP